MRSATDSLGVFFVLFCFVFFVSVVYLIFVFNYLIDFWYHVYYVYVSHGIGTVVVCVCARKVSK